MVIFGIILALSVLNCSIKRYLRCHLGFSDLLWCQYLVIIFGIILASWDTKAGIIRYRSCFGLGIFGLSWCLVLISPLVIFFCHHAIQKWVTSKTRNASFLASLDSQDDYFWVSWCQNDAKKDSIFFGILEYWHLWHFWHFGILRFKRWHH